VLSGSIVVAGQGRFQATAVGADAYARRIATEARRFSLTRSELMDGINQILKYVQWALVPTAILLAFSQFHVQHTTSEKINAVVAGVVAMVPEGLVLLTSLAVRSGDDHARPAPGARPGAPRGRRSGARRHRIARQDGHAHRGRHPVRANHEIEPDDPVAEALGALADDDNRNATMNALCEAFPAPAGWVRTAATPFVVVVASGSAVTFGEQGTWVLGAPEMVWTDAGPDDPVRADANRLAGGGQRVLLLARSEGALVDEELPGDMTPSALIVFEEKVRPDAAETLAYFADQSVRCMVISGDNPQTVGSIATRVGVPGADRPYDARGLPDDVDALADVLEDHSVYGRVSPQQKRAIVGALQHRGHYVAMTGDGVNDALALKDADIGIAMGSGAPATRAVAQVVLLDGRFSSMPSVVAEGRRVIANVERVAKPLRHQDLLRDAVGDRNRGGALALPVPAPSPHDREQSHHRDTRVLPRARAEPAPLRTRFVRRVFFIAGPAGVVAAAATFTAYAIARHYDELPVARTAATITILIVGLWGVEPARPADHAGAGIPVPRDGRRVRSDPRRGEAARLVRARPSERRVDLGGPRRRPPPESPFWRRAGSCASGRTPPAERTPRWAWRGVPGQPQA